MIYELLNHLLSAIVLGMFFLLAWILQKALGDVWYHCKEDGCKFQVLTTDKDLMEDIRVFHAESHAPAHVPA